MEIIKKIEQAAKDKNNTTNMVDINISENIDEDKRVEEKRIFTNFTNRY